MDNTHVKLALIDDHEMVIQGLSAIINSHHGLCVERTYLKGMEAIDDPEIGSVDIVLTDINMPAFDGFATLSELKKKHAHLKVILLSMEMNKKSIRKAQELGAAAYISKTASVEKVVVCVKSIYTGVPEFLIVES
ncbi:MAG: response regulator transcription factor [Bacteroidota bacterium]